MSTPELDRWLCEFLADTSHDPYTFVLGAFPWGRAGTSLENEEGPDEWQADMLKAMRDQLMSPGEALRFATSSGHGIGKSALVSWLILWAISTRTDTRGVVTANTENQLRTKTWAELAKWHGLFVGKSKFHYQATRISSTAPGHEMTWRIDMIPWSENNVEAFAGLHNQGKRVLLLFDEASAIADIIWETAEGAQTDRDTEIIWCVFGNPTRNTGRFRECWGRFRHRWKTQQIDSRTAKMTNKAQIAEWEKDYGDDSDFFRIRVRGVFPRTGSTQFIGEELVDAAFSAEALSNITDPLVMGVDVARFGDDMSVIAFRKGRDGRTIPPLKYRQVDTMTLAGEVQAQAKQYGADMVFIDGGGVGGGVVDRCRQLGLNVIEVQFGGKADRNPTGADSGNYANKRAEMWGNLRAWMRFGALPNDQDLRNELPSVEYAYNLRNEIQLEKKEDMKKRGLASPDVSDAFALTFAYEVAERPLAGRMGFLPQPAIVTDYDPFADV